MISNKFSAAVFTGMLAFIPEAEAHVSEHDKHTLVSNVDTKEQDVLADYDDFIKNMRLPGSQSTCCAGDDVVIKMHVTPNQDGSGSFTVHVPKGTFGVEKDVTFIVPKEKLLEATQARKICAEKPELQTCAAPDLPILWISPTSLKSPNPSGFCLWYPDQTF